MLLHERIKDLRLSRNLTQEQLAQELHISRSAYALYETGKRQLGYDILCTIADFYQVNIDYLFGRTDNPEQLFYLSLEERDLLKKFSKLDFRGKENIHWMLQLEYNRQTQNQNKKTRNNIQRLFYFITAIMMVTPYLKYWVKAFL